VIFSCNQVFWPRYIPSWSRDWVIQIAGIQTWASTSNTFHKRFYFNPKVYSKVLDLKKLQVWCTGNTKKFDRYYTQFRAHFFLTLSMQAVSSDPMLFFCEIVDHREYLQLLCGSL
jgi:hypothetical protein